TLSPAQVIEVHATRADDGKPLVGVWVSVLAYGPQRTSFQPSVGARTNNQGFARIIPPSGDSFSVNAFAPTDEPYLDTWANVSWPKGSVTQSLELKFNRGMRVDGTITEEESGKPVGGALVAYIRTTKNNPLARGDKARRSEAVCNPAGAFQIVVPAG